MRRTSPAQRHRLYLILVPLLVDGDDDFGNVGDELIAFGFPQRLHADLEVLDQNFLKWGWRRDNQLRDSEIKRLHASPERLGTIR